MPSDFFLLGKALGNYIIGFSLIIVFIEGLTNNFLFPTTFG